MLDLQNLLVYLTYKYSEPGHRQKPAVGLPKADTG